MSKTKTLTKKTPPSTITKAVSAQVVIAGIEKKAGKNFSALQKLSIVDGDAYDKAAQLLKELKNFKKEGETQEALIADPLKQALLATKSLFKPFYEKVSLIEQGTKSAMLDFLAAQEKKTRALQEKFDSGEIKKVSTLMGKTAALAVHSGFVAPRVTKEVIVDVLQDIPREFLMPDMQKIKAHYKDTGKVVKGCKLEERKGLAI